MTQPLFPAARLFDPVAARRIAAAAALCLALSGCSWFDDIFGKTPPPPLPGERISVLLLDRKLEPDPKVAALAVTVPPAEANDAWPQAGGTPQHAMGNPDLGADPREAWRSSIGSGSSDDNRQLTGPVIADGRIYVIDTDFTVTAMDVASGSRIWHQDVTREDQDGSALGGGVAVGEGRVVVGTGYAEVLSLDPASGAIQWRQKVPGPVRSAPTIADGRAYVVTIDNQLTVLSLKDGAIQWSHTGINETAGLLGTASAAIDKDIVVVPYSSGELFALRADNGNVVWQDSLAAIRRVGALSNLADIRGMPVIDRGLVVAVSHSGRIVGLDERTGGRAWEQEIGGIETPWSAGDFLYLVTNDEEVVCLTRDGGRIRWVTPLDRYGDPAKKQDPITWTGPVMGGGRLWLGSSTGMLVAISPENGKIVGSQDLGDGIPVPPIVVNRTLYVLTDAGRIVALK